MEPLPTADSVISSSEKSLFSSALIPIKKCKILHLIRHGEAVHNDAFNKHGIDELLKWQYFDAELTSVGIKQADGLKFQLVDNMKPEIVVVSPLTRALQTATIAFHQVNEDSSHSFSPPLIALEEIREHFGERPCDKRSAVRNLKQRFPHVNFDLIETDEDTLWQEERESTFALSQRAKRFFEWIQQRKETCIAVVTHGGFLSAFLPLVLDPQDMENQNFRMKNAEVRTFVVIQRSYVQ